MRLSSWFGVVLVGVLPQSCAESAAASRVSDGTLVLEVGGGQSSLREALAAVGITIGPAHLLWDREAAAGPGDAGNQPPPPGAGPEPGPGGVAPTAPPDPPPAPTGDGAATKVVTLKRGQTLIHLAKEHLGSGNRFRELLDLNGWSDAEARRLAEGTKVRVPVEAGRAPAKPKAGSGTPRNGR